MIELKGQAQVSVYIGEDLAQYSLGEQHPFGPGRMDAFWNEVLVQGLDSQLEVLEPDCATQEELERFHGHDYVEKVKALSEKGVGFLDDGDTPAFLEMYEAASIVVGSGLDALNNLIWNRSRRIFIPIAGLHHARRDSAAGFCVFNDCGVLIETLLKEYELERVLYVDIDAHHGDGVYYAFEDDPRVYIVDIHEDGRYLYPGTGSTEEMGSGKALGSKLNIPLLPGADDETLFACWPKVEQFIDTVEPEMILFQCGADSLKGDPLTHLAYSEAAHAFVTAQLCLLAEKHCEGRILALGGGGYNHENIAKAWVAVVNSMLTVPVFKE